MNWIKEIDNHNFLGIYDVLLDIRKELNISPERIIIPLLPNIIRFSQLLPADSIGLRDDYCDTRWKAVGFLKKQGLIDGFELLKGFHRWESQIEIKPNDKTEETLRNMVKEYKKRMSGKGAIKKDEPETFWDLLHPKVVEISKSRFEANHFADSVEAALKEINDIIKSIVKQKEGREYDGADLMNRAFSLQGPVILLDDLSTETGKNIQKGFMQIFSGTMTGIRNPKTHKNIEIDKKRAIHLLYLASLLMYKIDEQFK